MDTGPGGVTFRVLSLDLFRSNMVALVVQFEVDGGGGWLEGWF
jgi:hypothetical protein